MARSGGLDRVYTAIPADFIRTREAVAKELADSGRAKEAAAIRRLRKPTVPVWALNQLARQEPKTVVAFVKAVQDLSKAQRTGAGVPEAIQAERQARQRVIEQAEGLASATGVQTTADTTRRIAHTLLGAATDGDARDRLARGELQAEMQPSGFELFSGATLRAVKRGKPDTSRRQETAQVEERARELERIARQHRDTAAETAKKKARLEREILALDAAAKAEARAARAADTQATDARRKVRARRGGRGGAGPAR